MKLSHFPTFHPPFPLTQVSGLPPAIYALLRFKPRPFALQKSLAIYTEFRKYCAMKTTVVLPDEIFREAKARAALRGQSFGKFLEQGLRRVLVESDVETSSRTSSWLRELPPVSSIAATELQQVLSRPDFRPVDKSMW